MTGGAGTARLLEDCRVWLLIPLVIIIILLYDAYIAIMTPYTIPIVFPPDLNTFFEAGIGRFLADFLFISLIASVSIEIYWRYGRHPRDDY